MHATVLIARARRVCAALLAAGALASCHESPTDPSTRVQELRQFGDGVRVRAAAQSVVQVLVVDAAGSPVPGVAVSWHSSSGVLASAVTSSSTGGVASNLWTAPATPGEQVISASVGTVDVQPLEIVVFVTPGPVATLQILADSVHFTAQQQMRTLRVVGRDGQGNPVAVGYSDLQAWGNWLSAVATLPSTGDTAIVAFTSGNGTHRGYAGVTLDGVRDSVPLILEPVSTGVQSISGLDSLAGLLVGQHATVQVIGVDSLGHPVPGIDPTASGLQLSSADPNILSVSNDGSLTGVAAGQTVITASAGSVSYRVTVPVFVELDVGTRLAAFDLASGIDQRSDAQYLSDAGSLYSLHSSCCHNPGPTRLEAYGKDGRLSWSRVASANQYLNVLDPANGTVFSADADAHVIRALGPTGMELWTFDYGSFTTTMGCMIAGWRDGVAAWCGSHVLALHGDGSLAWSAPIEGAPWRMLTTPTHVVVESRDSLSAFDTNGRVAWTRAVTPSEMIADASSNVYLMEKDGVRAIDGNGVERWFTSIPLGACVIATTDHLVVCRDNALLVALDPTDGHVRWSTTIPIPFGGPVAISGDRLLVLGGHLFALDARSGAMIARSADSYDNSLLSVADGFMSMSMPSHAITFRTSFSPGSEWSQTGGNAGHGNRVTP